MRRWGTTSISTALLLAALMGCKTASPPGPAWPEAKVEAPLIQEDGSTAPAQPTREPYWWELPKDEQPRLHGGLYGAAEDSLGFADYRALPGEEQLARRERTVKLLRLGKQSIGPHNAQHQYATAVGLCPYLPEGWQLYAETQLDLGYYESAEAFLHCAERTLRFAGNQRDQDRVGARVYQLWSLTAYNLGDIEGALVAADRSLEYDSNDQQVQLHRARVLTDLGEYERARFEIMRFGFNSPYYAPAQAVLGILEMKSGNLDTADDAFAEAHEYGMRGAIFENDRGRLRLEQGRSEDAASHFRSAIDNAPDLMEARNNLAVALRRSGDDDAAERVLKEAIQINAGHGAAHFNLAELLRSRLEDLDDAERLITAQRARNSYTRALDLGHQPRIALQRRATVALMVGDYAHAEADLLELAGDPEADGRLLYLLGRAKKDQDELRIAEQLYRMAIDRGYGDAVVYSDLGEVQLRRIDLEGASASLRRAIEMDSSLVATRINYCVTLIQLGDFAGAERALQAAEGLAPNDPRVRAQRAELNEMLGRD